MIKALLKNKHVWSFLRTSTAAFFGGLAMQSDPETVQMIIDYIKLFLKINAEIVAVCGLLIVQLGSTINKINAKKDIEKSEDQTPKGLRNEDFN